MEHIDTELLISLVKDRPTLWDKTQKCYQNKQSTYVAWKDICIALNDDFETLSDKEQSYFGKCVIKKWNNTRDYWVKHHRRIKKHKSDSGAKKIQKYKFYDNMLFLSKIVSNRRSNQPNITSVENVTEIEACELLNELTNSKTKNVTNAQTKNTANIRGANKRKKLKDVNEVDKKIIDLINSIENDDDSRIMCFFKGIAPTIDKYNDDEMIEFQYEVIKVMRNISQRNKRNSSRDRGMIVDHTASTLPLTTIQEYSTASTPSSTSRHPTCEYQTTQEIDINWVSSDNTEKSTIENDSSDYDSDASTSP